MCLLVAISEGSDWGWSSPRTIGLFLAAAVLLVAWIHNELRAAEPLVDMTMMRIRGVWTVNVAAFLVGAGMYSSFILIPSSPRCRARAGYGFGASRDPGRPVPAAVDGRRCCSSARSPGAWPEQRRLARAADPRLDHDLGVLRLCWRSPTAIRWEIYVGSALLGAGIGLAFASLANLIVEAVRPDQTGVATA